MYLICLVPGTLLYANLASNRALSVASYLYGMNFTWTYGYLGNLALDRTYEIDVAGLVVVLVWIFFL